MGGFRVNGCGVTDHFKKIKSLGIHKCPSCGREAEFFLEEAKQKIDVLFIPTLTLKSRKAVMCSSCQQGQFCSEEWAAALILGRTPGGVLFEDQAAAVPTPQPTPQPAPQPAPQPTPQPTPQPAPRPQRVPSAPSMGVPSFFKCTACGVTQLREGPFCAYCGHPAPPDPDAAAEEPRREETPPEQPPLCPACGAPQTAGGKFCMACGQPLAGDQPPRPAPKPVCPQCGAQAEEGMRFCMECGSKL